MTVESWHHGLVDWFPIILAFTALFRLPLGMQSGLYWGSSQTGMQAWKFLPAFSVLMNGSTRNIVPCFLVVPMPRKKQKWSSCLCNGSFKNKTTWKHNAMRFVDVYYEALWWMMTLTPTATSKCLYPITTDINLVLGLKGSLSPYRMSMTYTASKAWNKVSRLVILTKLW